MKVGELRKKLASLKKEEIIQLAVEFYKAVPKAKKESTGLDDMVNNPGTKKKRKTKSTETLKELEETIPFFIENVRDQNYLVPNRIVPKKERSKWRFLVKRWYKALLNTKREDADLKLQARLMEQLFEVLCESCNYQYFTAYDTFESVGIEQHIFFKSVLELIGLAEGKSKMAEKSAQLILSPLNRYTLSSDFMIVSIELFDIPDLKEAALKATLSLKNTLNANSKSPFRIQFKHNKLVEYVFRLKIALSELDAAVDFFQENYIEKEAEIKLFVLIRILISLQNKTPVLAIFEEAFNAGIKPRVSLMKVYKMVKEENQLPEYMPPNRP